ncbi:MAG: helix-turn-helix domain-containing protein [Lachnospiraceae bacterium]|nr:helix-turn-helix domain-containing protein [Lachnospiraceae bacterium]
MGKGSINDNTNVYFRARKEAATYNERLYSREGAAELLGISVSTLADYELGNTKVVPVDKVVLMADLYNAPELISGYCVHECPIHGFLPLATKEKNLQGIALRLLKGFNEEELKQMKSDLIDVTADGDLTEEEIPKLNEIMKKLEGLAGTISEMKIVTEKFIRNLKS